MNEEILNKRRVCHEADWQWKSTELEAHRLYLQELIRLFNELVKNDRTTDNYFANLPASKGEKKKSWNIVSTQLRTLFHQLLPLSVFTNAECNLFLNYLTKLSSSHLTCLCLVSLLVIHPFSLQWHCKDIAAPLGKIKLSSSPLWCPSYVFCHGCLRPHQPLCCQTEFSVFVLALCPASLNTLFVHC